MLTHRLENKQAALSFNISDKNITPLFLVDVFAAAFLGKSLSLADSWDDAQSVCGSGWNSVAAYR